MMAGLMERMRSGLRTAFAVRVKDEGVSEEEAVVVDRVCREVARRGLTTPAIMLIEMSRPLNYVSAQLMHFFQPIVAIVTDTREYDAFSAFLERRGSMDHLCKRLEHFDAALNAGARDGGAADSGATSRNGRTP